MSFFSLVIVYFTAFPSAINPPATGKTFNAYLNAAKALGPNEKPVC